MGQYQSLFVYFRSFQTFLPKTVDLSGIQTQIIIVEGWHADHQKTATAHFSYSVLLNMGIVNFSEISVVDVIKPFWGKSHTYLNA